MKPLLDIDEWLLKQYQKAADWCYSEWDVSPYAVAAQLFAATAILGVVLYCFGGPLLLFGMMLSINTIWFWLAVHRDASWKKKRMPMPLTFVDTALRIYLFIVVCSSVGISVFLLFTNGSSIRDTADTFLLFASLSAFYFYACHPPTFIKRRDHKLVPQT